MPPTRRHFLQTAIAAATVLPFAAPSARAANAASSSSAAPSADGTLPQEKTHTSPEKLARNHAHMVEADGRLRCDFGEERMIMDGGLQPFLLCTKAGTLVLQAQSPNPPFPSSRMHYSYAMWTTVSRDGGKTWTRLPLKP